MNESILIKKCQSGSQEAFSLLYRKYHSLVWQISYGIMGNKQDAEDAAQEVFTRLLSRIKQFRYEAAFTSWLRVMVSNICRDMLRKQNRHPTESLEYLNSNGELNIKSMSISQEEALIMEELLDNLNEKISLLKEKHRKLIILRYIDGLSYRKIAQLVGCTESQVKSRLHQARVKLRHVCQSLRNEGK
ncbi:sigma-70 family RNA polymerase sigma factor [Candidatus Poribacteria bacterium]|nr:sigma-70 family RNA polymerase sigma factor [Candidatus Poribacteria bacterium]